MSKETSSESLQSKINKHLMDEVKREALIKKAAKKAQLSYEQRRAAARLKIHDLEELKKLEDDYLNDFEEV